MENSFIVRNKYKIIFYKNIPIHLKCFQCYDIFKENEWGLLFTRGKGAELDFDLRPQIIHLNCFIAKGNSNIQKCQDTIDETKELSKVVQDFMNAHSDEIMAGEL